MTRLSEGLFLADDSSKSVCRLEELIDFYEPTKLKKTGTTKNQLVSLNSENPDKKSGTHLQKYWEMRPGVSRKKDGKNCGRKARKSSAHDADFSVFG